MQTLSQIAGWVTSALVAIGLVVAPMAPTLINYIDNPPAVSHYVSDEEEPLVGAAVPQSPALYDGYLASGISTTDTTMTLSTGVLRNGQALSGYFCFTVDVNTPTVEYICGTASSTSVTNLMRGVDVLNPNATSSSLVYSHRRFASVSISDYPTLQIVSRKLNGTDSFDAVLSYTTGVTPVGLDDIADVGYVLGAISGTSTLSFDKQVITGTAGETVATNTVVYLNVSDARWYVADADLAQTYTNVTLGMTQGSGATAGAVTNGVLISGLHSLASGLTVGRNYFLSGTAGAIQTATTSKFVGQARSATTLVFDPGLLDTQIARTGNVNTFTATNTFSGTTTFTGNTVGFGLASTTVYTTTGSSTYIKSPFVKYIVVEVQAAGGGGAGYDTDGTDGPAASGSGGGYSRKLIPAAGLGATETIMIGASGSGGVSQTTPTSGTNGSNTTFGAHITAGGGRGATANSATIPVGGTATGGDLNIPGTGGSPLYGATSPGYSEGGYSFMGFGSKLQNSTVIAGTGYGYGGAGGADSGPIDGQSGGPAMVSVTEHF